MERFLVSILLASVLVACSSDQPNTTSAEPSQTAPESAAPDATASAAPSPTPERSPTAKAALRVLKKQDIPIGVTLAYTAGSDPNALLGRPGQYTGKVNFQDKRIPLEGSDPNHPEGPDVSIGGSIESFRKARDGKARLRYVKGVTRSAAFLAEYDFLLGDGLILLRLSHELTPSQARKYKRALISEFGR